MTNMQTEKLTPQHRKIINHVKKVGYISARPALIDLGIAALPRRIVDLKRMGYLFDKEFRKNPSTGQRYVRYIYKGKISVGDTVETPYGRATVIQTGRKNLYGTAVFDCEVVFPDGDTEVLDYDELTLLSDEQSLAA